MANINWFTISLTIKKSRKISVVGIPNFSNLCTFILWVPWTIWSLISVCFLSLSPIPVRRYWHRIYCTQVYLFGFHSNLSLLPGHLIRHYLLQYCFCMIFPQFFHLVLLLYLFLLFLSDLFLLFSFQACHLQFFLLFLFNFIQFLLVY